MWLGKAAYVLLAGAASEGAASDLGGFAADGFWRCFTRFK